ncbi:MAG: Endonuclease, Uma2 family (restriction endonuclease fold) [Candidatus Kentron sp. G]|nr:MAG: Endonuclease, Uma2 family (restriction endonuclease fold) [Candidatus Kentron sp. G]VFN02364.1 MAG: Endonuclease, Uma2 family (restriction endonuclease fold) [Candidatus Kentron sp. G]VFN04090.1 MAG: Endonuclease, Uma2 family (restriction endonuclease fold) [Candidatus Kentron sp. G]
MREEQPIGSHGPFTADQIKDGDRYELSNGNRIYCAPAGENHARHNVTGASLLDSDPNVQWSGVDAGFVPRPNTLRAPDVSVAPPPEKKKGWIPGVPPLAVEYADHGQNESDLKMKIRELLAAGTRYVWVVRLIGPQRVEVYTKDRPRRLLSTTDTLEAPGILRNRVPVRALFDRKEAHRVTLRNLLQREGYEDLDAVLQEGVQRGKTEGLLEGKAKGKAEGKIEGALAAQVKALFSILAARGLDVDNQTHAHIRNCRDSARLETWLTRAAVADRLEDVFRES